MKATLNTVLAAVCVVIVLAIIIGTGIVFGSRKAQPGVDLRRPEPPPVTNEQIIQAQKELQEQQARQAGRTPEPTETTGEFGTYTNLGQIRTSTMVDPETQTAALVIVEPWFSYTSDDPAFQEELDNKRQKIRSLFLQLFATHTFQQLRTMGEEQVKAMLLESVNRELMLGKLSGVFFEDYLFLE